MLSRDDLERLKIWQLQLNGAVAAQEHRLESLERCILKSGTVPQLTVRSLALLDKAIAICKKTITQLEQASSHLATLIDFYDRQVNETSPTSRASRGANLVPKHPDTP